MWNIEFYDTERGKRPVQEFLDSLDAKVKAKVARTLDLLEEFGIALGMPYAKPVEGDLWELRVRVGTNRYRFLYFLFTGNTFVILHGFIKKSSAITPQDLRIARDRKKDYLSRKG